MMSWPGTELSFARYNTLSLFAGYTPGAEVALAATCKYKKNWPIFYTHGLTYIYQPILLLQ